MPEKEELFEAPQVDDGLAGGEATSKAALEPAAAEHDADKRDLPPLLADRAFWGMTTTQFLGAFNDNVFKQLILLLAVTAPAAAATATSSQPPDYQGWGMALFAAPFILFSGFAGYLSERNGKRLVIVLSKVAEIVAMLAGMAAFAAYGTTGLAGLFVVLFFMGAQSAFFGPGKYGILPELFRERDLPQANGIILMTTFLAIIFGAALAGVLTEQFGDHLWIASGVCVVIAVLGTLTSLAVRYSPPADPHLRLTPSAFAVPADLVRQMAADRPLCWALLASCMFWLVGGIVQMSVNSLGKVQLQVGDQMTSFLVAGVGLGIAVGCVLAGKLSRGKVNFTVMRTGAWGIVACLTAVALLNPPDNLLPAAWKWLSDPQTGIRWRYGATMAALIAAGAFTGLFTVPLQVFLQSRPPKNQKGRMIATMNLANWIAIIIGAVIYLLFDKLLGALAWPRSTLFLLTALLMLPVALLYRPRNEALS